MLLLHWWFSNHDRSIKSVDSQFPGPNFSPILSLNVKDAYTTPPLKRALKFTLHKDCTLAEYKPGVFHFNSTQDMLSN